MSSESMKKILPFAQEGSEDQKSPRERVARLFGVAVEDLYWKGRAEVEGVEGCFLETGKEKRNNPYGLWFVPISPDREPICLKGDFKRLEEDASEEE